MCVKSDDPNGQASLEGTRLQKPPGGTYRPGIVAFVRSNPGAHIASIATALGIDWSTAEYHLRVLARRGRVRELHPDHRRLFYPGGETRVCPSTLLTAATRRVLDALRATGPLCATELAAHLGMARSAVSRHLDILQERDLAVRLSAGRVVPYLAREEAPEALDERNAP